METTSTISIIKNSFEQWYNKNVAKTPPVSIIINYSDTQRLSVKAFHTITMDVKAVGIKDGVSYAIPIVYLKENYNHGITTEQEAKEYLTEKLLIELYGFKKN